MQLDLSTLSLVNEGVLKVDGTPIDIHFVDNSCWCSEWQHIHYHTEYIELLYAAKGTFSVMLEGIVYDMEEGSLFLIPAGSTHTTRCHQSNDPTGNLMCAKFSPNIFYSILPNSHALSYYIPLIIDRVGKDRYLPPDVIKNSCIPKEYEMLAQEEQTHFLGSDLAQCASVFRIFTWVLRYWYQKSMKNNTDIFNFAMFKTIQKVKTYVLENYQTANLSDASKQCHLNYSYLSHLFRQQTGHSFNDYVNLIRVNNSIKDLSKGEKSITNIAIENGFSSTSHYIQIFKKHKKITPNKFRKIFENQ